MRLLVLPAVATATAVVEGRSTAANTHIVVRRRTSAAANVVVRRRSTAAAPVVVGRRAATAAAEPAASSAVVVVETSATRGTATASAKGGHTDCATNTNDSMCAAHFNGSNRVLRATGVSLSNWSFDPTPRDRHKAKKTCGTLSRPAAVQVIQQKEEAHKHRLAVAEDPNRCDNWR
jgi:hypothetical protein